jgi:L-ascorbate metabolism protein UlaG (beta-lactamase superfamily)
MYNLTRGPAAGQLYHTKGRGNGYVITLGGKRIYIAGDTEGVPEMRALKNIDVAFIPMNLPYTMTPEEAADAVKAFHPAMVYPYHYRGSDVQAFANALKGTGIDVRVRDWYAK